MQYGLIVFQMHYVKKKMLKPYLAQKVKCVYTYFSSGPHLYFVRTPPLFRPEMMFSYFTPKLQQKNWHFLVRNIKISFDLPEGLWNKDLHELFYAKLYL